MASLKSLQKRYDRCLKDDDFYGAEQACRMMHHRLTQSKSASQEDLDRSFEILLNGAVTLLQNHQVQAGTALALLAMKHCEDYKVPVTDLSIKGIKAILQSFGAAPAGDDTAKREFKREKLRFLKAAVAWSSRKACSGYQNGHAELNTLAAKAACETEDFELAERLFVNSDDPKGFATFLHHYAEHQVLPSEKALVLTRAVLKYLVTENLKDAVTLRAEFARISGWKSIEANTGASDASGTATDAPPLGHFCELLLKLCQLEAAAAPLYTKVVESYNAELKRDEAIPPMLATLGAKYFGIQPPQPSGLGGMMNSMLRGLMSQ